MKRQLIIVGFILWFILAVCSFGAFPTHTSTGTFNVATSGDSAWDDFEWYWSDQDNQQMALTFNGATGGTNIMFRLALPKTGPYWLQVNNCSLTDNGTNTTYSLPVALCPSNIPPNEQYYAEFIYIQTGNVQRTIARGTVWTEWSLFSITNSTSWVPVSITYFYPTQSVSAAELDPLWSASASYGITATMVTNWHSAQAWVNAYSNKTPTNATVLNVIDTNRMASWDAGGAASTPVDTNSLIAGIAANSNAVVAATNQTSAETVARIAHDSTNAANNLATSNALAGEVTARIAADTNKVSKMGDTMSGTLTAGGVTSSGTVSATTFAIGAGGASVAASGSSSSTGIVFNATSLGTHSLWYGVGGFYDNAYSIFSQANLSTADIWTAIGLRATEAQRVIDSNTFAAADALKLNTSTWAAADSTTNYTPYLAYKAATAALWTAHSAETNARIEADATLTTAHSAETNARIAGDALAFPLSQTNTAPAFTNYMSRVAQVSTNAGFQSAIDGKVSDAGILSSLIIGQRSSVGTNLSAFTLTGYTGVIGGTITYTAICEVVAGNTYDMTLGLESTYLGTSWLFCAGTYLTNGAVGTQVSNSLPFSPSVSTGLMYLTISSVAGMAQIVTNATLKVLTAGSVTIVKDVYLGGTIYGDSDFLTNYQQRAVEDISLGIGANGNNSGIAIGLNATATDQGVGIGETANGNDDGVSVGHITSAHDEGVAIGRLAVGDNQGVAAGNGANGSSNGVAVGYSASGVNGGIAVGSGSIGSASNTAIGYGAKANGGVQRVAVGFTTTNGVDNSSVLRGTLYLDGGTGVMYRSTFGTGDWGPWPTKDGSGLTNLPITADGATVTQTSTGTHISVASGGVTNLYDLHLVDSDVAPTADDVLVWNGAAWSNAPFSASVTNLGFGDVTGNYYDNESLSNAVTTVSNVAQAAYDLADAAATGTPLYVETDPVWAATQDYYRVWGADVTQTATGAVLTVAGAQKPFDVAPTNDATDGYVLAATIGDGVTSLYYKADADSGGADLSGLSNGLLAVNSATTGTIAVAQTTANSKLSDTNVWAADGMTLLTADAGGTNWIPAGKGSYKIVATGAVETIAFSITDTNVYGTCFADIIMGTSVIAFAVGSVQESGQGGYSNWVAASEASAVFLKPSYTNLWRVYQVSGKP